MKHSVIPAAALLRLLTALSAVQVSFGTNSLTCQIPVLSKYSCQESLVVDVSAQLNHAEQQIYSLNVNQLYDDITEALRRINKATAEAVNLKTEGIYLSRSYQTYVKLAESLASQVGRQDCYLNYSKLVTEDIYSRACARITSAVSSYLDNLKAVRKDLIRLKVAANENPPSVHLLLLESCLSIQASGPRSVRDCLQSYVHDYKVFVYDLSSQVKFDLNRMLSAEQCPYFKALKNKIDDSVAVAAYDVKRYAEEVLYCAGLSPRALYEHSLNEIDTFIALYKEILHLQQNVTREIRYADGNFTSDFKSTIRNYLSPISEVAELGLLYAAPKKHATLKTLLANTENMIQSVLVNVSKQLKPTRDTLIAINATLKNTAKTLKQAIDDALNGINSCLPKCIDDYVNRINEFSCFTESLNAVRSILPDVEIQFSTACAQFQPNPDNERNILRLIVDNYAYLYNYGKTTAGEICNLLGSTRGNSISEQIVTSLTNDYRNNVSQMVNSIQPVKLQLQNYTDTAIERMDSNITDALKTIQDVIKIMQEVKPAINVSALNATYNRLYNSLKENMSDYINGAYRNFTGAIDFQTVFNLTAQTEELQAELNSCTPQNENTWCKIGYNNLKNVTKCFEPYVKNFIALLNSTLESIRTIVEGVDSLKKTALSSVANYTASVLHNATAIAIVVAETSLVQCNMTSDALDQAAVDELASFRQVEIDPLLNYITKLIDNVKTNNLRSVANLISSVNASVQPWAYAISICNTSNASVASNLSSQYPLISQLINNTVNSVLNTTPYKQDAIIIQAEFTNFTALLNKMFSDYNSTALSIWCSRYKNASRLQYIDCLKNVTEEAKTIITGTCLAELRAIVDKTDNLTKVADASLAATVATQLTYSNGIATAEGKKIISMCNVTIETIQNKCLERLKSYNITPIYNYAASMAGFADTMMQRSTEMLKLGNYTVYTSIYVMNDAVGSAGYVTGWKYPFSNEMDFANSVIDAAIRKCMNAYPNVTQDAYDMYATAVDINKTLDYRVSLLAPSRLSLTCPPNLTNYYAHHKCVSGAVNSFGAYHTDEMKAARNASDAAYSLLANDTAKLNAWKDTVVIPEAAAVVQMLKPLAEKLLKDYNCTVDKLLGYAVHIIDQRYDEYEPTVISTANVIYTSVANVLQTDHSSILNIMPLLVQFLQPLDVCIAVMKNSTNQTLLTEDVLSAPSGFVTNATATFQAFLWNIKNQANVIQNNTETYVDNVETMYQALNYTSIHNKCYNASNRYPLLEMVACYNRLHYDFYVYLDNAQTQLKAYSTQIADLDVNVVTVITHYTDTLLLPQFKRNVCVYTAILYRVAGLRVPPELQPCLPIPDGRCKVEIIVKGKLKCVIVY